MPELHELCSPIMLVNCRLHVEQVNGEETGDGPLTVFSSHYTVPRKICTVHDGTDPAFALCALSFRIHGFSFLHNELLLKRSTCMEHTIFTCVQ